MADRAPQDVTRPGERRTVRLTFPYGTKPEQVTAFCRGLAGLLPPWWRRWVETPVVIFNTHADTNGIRHELDLPQPQAEYVLAQLRGALSGVSVEAIEPAPLALTTAAEYRLSNHHLALRSTPPEPMAAGLLATLQPLGEDEGLILQWLLSPAPAPPFPRRSNPSMWDLLVLREGASAVPVDEAAAQRAKRSEPAFWAVCRIGARAADARRARQLLRRVEGALHPSSAPGVSFRRRWLPASVVASRLVRGAVPLTQWPALLNANELAALAPFPLGPLTLPGLTLAGARQLAPPAALPSGGRVVGRATFAGAQRQVALSVEDSLRHLHVVGPTGTGKSTFLLNLICGDVAAGRGVVVIDPKGDLVADVLDRLPRRRVRDVVLLDPTDAERPVGFNVLAQAGGTPELAADQVVSIFRGLFSAFWGPRTDDILRASLLTLLQQPGMTLAEVPQLLTDERFRRRLTARLDDYTLEGFWGWYEALSPAERAQAIGPVLNKARTFLLRPRLRAVIGQSESTFSLPEVLAERRILLVSLAKGLLGEDAAGLLGAAVIAGLWQAVQARAALPVAERTPVFVFIDEFQSYLRLPTDLADVLAQARAYGLGLTLAHQHLGQLPADLRQAVLANARSKVVFALPATDARTMAREFEPYLSASDLQGLGAYEAVLAGSAGAQTLPPTTISTLPPPASTGVAAAARTRSRNRYGADRAEVDAAMRERVSGSRRGGAVGSRRRA